MASSVFRSLPVDSDFTPWESWQTPKSGNRAIRLTQRCTQFKSFGNKTICSKYLNRDLLIVLPRPEPSIFRGIAVSLLRPVIASNFEIEWRTKQIPAALKWLYKYFTSKSNSIYWKFDFHSHHQALASLGNTSTNGMFIQYFIFCTFPPTIFAWGRCFGFQIDV